MSRSLGLSLYLALVERDHGHQLETGGDNRPDGPLIWLHASTETQVVAFGELIARLSEDRDELHFLLTIETPAAMAEANVLKSSDRTIKHLLISDDTRFVDVWKPDAVVWTDGPRHPAIMSSLADARIPQFLVDVGTELPAVPIRQRIPGLRRGLLTLFEKILTRDEASGKYINSFAPGAEKVEVTGELQGGAVALPCNDADRDIFGAKLSARPVWLAAVCTRKECEIALLAHSKALRISHRLLLILVPEPGESAEAVAALADNHGFHTARRDLGDYPEEDTQVYIADSIDEMGLWYRLAPISFIGQTFDGTHVAHPYDPAALGSAVLYGPSPGVVNQAFARLENAGAAKIVLDSEDLARAVEQLQSPDRAAIMAHNAWTAISGGALVIDRLEELLSEVIDYPEGHPHESA